MILLLAGRVGCPRRTGTRRRASSLTWSGAGMRRCTRARPRRWKSTVTGEDVTFEELGGAHTHMAKSGVAHYQAADEEDGIEFAKLLLSCLPSNNLDEPPPSPGPSPHCAPSAKPSHPR